MTDGLPFNPLNYIWEANQDEEVRDAHIRYLVDFCPERLKNELKRQGHCETGDCRRLGRAIG